MSDERAVLQRVLDEADTFLGGLDDRPVRPQTDVDGVVAVLGGPLPEQPSELLASSPAAAGVEQVAAGWLLDLLGLPTDAAVGFVTGGMMANFTCLAAARDAVLRRAGWDVETDGLQGAPRVSVVLGEERHDTVDVALRYLG